MLMDVKARVGAWFGICFWGAWVLVCPAEDALRAVASEIGGAGSICTNGDYVLTSSWRQQIGTSVSAGGEYVNSSGFLAASAGKSAGKSAFSILTAEHVPGPPPRVRITVPTALHRFYSIQFTDFLRVGEWRSFGSTNNGVGTYFETNALSAFTFEDDFTTNTSGSTPDGARFYRVSETQ